MPDRRTHDATLEGVVPILVTPFDNEGAVDIKSLCRLIDFNIEAGVHGLGVAIGSEIFRLDDHERDLVNQTVIKQVNGRVPVVINTSAPGTEVTLRQCAKAEQAGADALMIYAPHFVPISAADTVGFYQAIDRAVDIPIILQDIPQAPISAGMAAMIAESCTNVTHIKVETLPVTEKVSAMVGGTAEKLTVFGGAGGGYFIEELRRGARGTMPFCSQPAAFVKTWDEYIAGNDSAAREVFDSAVMPVNRLGGQGGDLFFRLHKQLLVKLGVIDTAYVRGPTIVPDAVTQREIDTLVDHLVAMEV